jgi:hypothetical protein
MSSLRVVTLAAVLSACTEPLAVRASRLADEMCAATDRAQLDAAVEKAMRDAELRELNDPGRARAIHAHDPDVLAALDRIETCRERVDPPR